MPLKKGSRRKYSASEIWGYHQDTPSERKLEAALNKAGVSFEREVPVKQFTVDFHVDDWLIVEVDGESHLTTSRQAKDRSRQKILENSGFTVIRVPAMDVSNEAGLKQWVSRIKQLAKQGPPGLAKPGFQNIHFKNQVETARRELMEQARKAGLAAQKRRTEEASRYGRESSRASRPFTDTGETMDDYFGSEAEDFKRYIEEYDWSKTPLKDEPEKRQIPRKRRKHK